MQGFVELENDRLSLRVSPKGGAVVDGRTRDGQRFLRRHDDGAFDVLRSACFPLVPIGNRVEGNGFELGGKSYRFKPNTTEPNYIHGDGWLAEWKVEDASATHVGSPSSSHALSIRLMSIARFRPSPWTARK